MPLNKDQNKKLSNAVVAWSRKNNTDIGDLIGLTATEKRDALAPFVRADRDATIVIQGKLAVVRATEDADLQQSVDDCNAVLQALDSGTLETIG
jgi:hypothetical protein